MIQALNEKIGSAVPARWSQRLLLPALLRRRVFALALLANLCAGIYWGLLASDRYISDAHVVVQRTDFSGGQVSELSGLLSGLGNANHADQLILRDYLKSYEILALLDAQLGLRKHYADSQHDALSRLADEESTKEEFHRYFMKRISVEFDSYAGVLVIQVQAFEPKMARDIAKALMEAGERKLNAMGHELAQEQVSFLEKQVAEMNTRAMAARQAVIDFQNAKGLVSPLGEVETRASIAAKFEGQLAELNTRRAAMLAYLMPESPKIREIDAQIGAVEAQIQAEKSRLAAPGGKTLNSTVEEYQRLTMAAEFAGQVYKTALGALERGRVDAMRTLKKLSVLQPPTLPEYSVEPRRIYNFVVFLLVSLLLAGIVHLIAAIIRDHKD